MERQNEHKIGKWWTEAVEAEPPSENNNIAAALTDFFASGYGPRILATVVQFLLTYGRCPTTIECQKAMFKNDPGHRNSLRIWCARNEKALSPFLTIRRRKGRAGCLLVPTRYGLKLAGWLLCDLPNEYQRLLNDYEGCKRLFSTFKNELLQLFSSKRPQ